MISIQPGTQWLGPQGLVDVLDVNPDHDRVRIKVQATSQILNVWGRDRFLKTHQIVSESLLVS